MINHVSATASEATVTAVSPKPSQASTTQASAPKEDSVHLSPKAQAAASGDVDHDGDSH